MIVSQKLTVLVIDMRKSYIHEPSFLFIVWMSVHSYETLIGLINETMYLVLHYVGACDINWSIIFAVQLKHVLTMYHQVLVEFMYMGDIPPAPNRLCPKPKYWKLTMSSPPPTTSRLLNQFLQSWWQYWSNPCDRPWHGRRAYFTFFFGFWRLLR